MHVGLIGMSYKSCSLELREQFIRACKQIDLSKKVLLSTCHRTEIYFSAEDIGEEHCHLMGQCRAFMQAPFESRVYSHFDRQCFAHLAQVTCGVDSVLFGETEVQRQVKEAYEEAAQNELSSALHFLFQKSLKIGKEMRTRFSLPKGSLSIESTLWEMITYFFQKKEGFSLLRVGYSEMNRKISSFFRKKGLHSISWVTRNPKAAMEEGFSAFSWDFLSHWSEFDVVISASKALLPLLIPDHLALKDPSQIRTRLIIDLGVPRNVDPRLEKNPQIALFNIDEVGTFMEQAQKRILQEERDIERLIEEKALEQQRLYQEKRRKSEALCTC
jgi:glutamyl-tRNA reductase